MSAIEMMALALSWIAVLFVTFVSQTGATKLCPHVVRVETGTNFTIKCKADENITDFYWYKGQASDNDLLGTLEKGTKIVSRGHKDDYDISRSGALVILNAGIRHEFLYDLVTFDAKGSFKEEEVIVNITVSPFPPCPLISNCPPCAKCELLQTSTSGTLTCKVEGSRPLVSLNWTTPQTGVNIFQRQPQIKQRDVFTDSWDNSVIVDYNMTVPCEVKIVLQCVAQDDLHILNSTVSPIEISKADQCNAVTSANIHRGGTSPSGKNGSAAVLVPVILLSFVVVGVALVIYKRIRKAIKVKQLVKTTKAGYKRFCYLQPLPWGKEIDIADLYTKRQCTITDEKGIPCTEKNITRQRLVIFMGEHGDGRTTFLKNVIYEWIEGREDVLLLIFIPLKEVEMNKRLSTFVIEDILETSQFKPQLVEEILRDKNKHCLVILDGLEDLQESFKQGMGDLSVHKQIEKFVTIGGLLQGRVNGKYKNLHIWISSRQADCESSWCPKNYVKVVMNGFTKPQFSRYVRKCCLYYTNHAKDTDKMQFTRMTEEDNEVFYSVEKFLEENSVLEDYDKTPLLVNLMVHIIAAKYTSAVDYLDDKTITNMSTLIHVVIECMKARYMNKNPSSRTQDFSTLENKLGEVALQQRTQLTVRDCKFWVKEIGDDNVKTARKIGLLKLTKDSPSTAKFSGIEFYHQRIQEFLAALYIFRTREHCSDYEQIVEQCGDNKGYRIKLFLRELEDL